MSTPATMKAIVLDHFGGLDALVIKDIPTPVPTPGHVLIRIKAFGINHAEMHMRRGEWAEAAPVSGIECVGLVESCPGSEFATGTPVAALMGGLGRTISGSYAEYTLAPARNVAAISADLPSAELAALPESYATAWTALFRNLELQRGETLLVRALPGRARSRRQRRRACHRDLAQRGAVPAAAGQGGRARGTGGPGPVRAPRGHAGGQGAQPRREQRAARFARDSAARRARVPRGLAPLPDFDPLSQMASGVHLSFFGSFVFGSPQVPLADVPLQAIAEDVAAGRFDAKPAAVFRFENIREAHRTMEENKAGGKMVVVI